MSPSCWLAWSTDRCSPPGDPSVVSTSASSRRSPSTAANNSSDRATRRQPAPGTPPMSRTWSRSRTDGMVRPRETGIAPSVTCSTTSVSRWIGPSNRATPTSHAPSPPGSDGSGTWAAASTTPGDGSRRRCHSESRRGRAAGSARSHGVGSSAWSTTPSLRWNTVPKPSHARVRWATRRPLRWRRCCTPRRSTTSFIEPRPRRSWRRSRGTRSRRSVTVGVAPWRRSSGARSSWCTPTTTRRLPNCTKLRRSSAKSETRGPEASRCAMSPTSRRRAATTTKRSARCGTRSRVGRRSEPSQFRAA